MKKIFLGILSAVGFAAPTMAADLPVRATPPPIPVPIFTWTGFYLGGNIGAGWTSTVIRESFFGAEWSRSSDARFIGGGQIGYNWQFNQFVVGLEGDIDAITNRSRSAVVTIPAGTFVATRSSDANWVSTIAARFGFAVDRALFYGKAGYGWVGGTGNATITNVATGATVGIGGSGNRGGWLVGGGIEYAITNNWTLKGEYNYLATGRDRTFFVPVGAPFLVGDTFTTNGRNVSMVKFGFNYLFR